MERKYRKHIRLKNHDYSKPGYYFVTVCTRDRRNLFVTAVDPRFGYEADYDVAARPWRAQRRTEIVVEKLDLISEKFAAFVDFYVIVPNHIHFILVLNAAGQGPAATERGVGERPAAKEKEEAPHPVKLRHGTSGGAATKKKIVELPWVINAFKGWCTREFGKSLFQPNYYEHVIRNEKALGSIRQYILENPYKEFDNIEWKRIEGV